MSMSEITPGHETVRALTAGEGDGMNESRIGVGIAIGAGVGTAFGAAQDKHSRWACYGHRRGGGYRLRSEQVR